MREGGPAERGERISPLFNEGVREVEKSLKESFPSFPGLTESQAIAIIKDNEAAKQKRRAWADRVCHFLGIK